MTTKNTIISLSPVIVPVTPFYYAKASRDMFEAGRGLVTDDGLSSAKFNIFCISIELGLKAAILAKDCCREKKAKVKALGHNLHKILNVTAKDYDIGFYSKNDRKAIQQISPFFCDKSLEYLTDRMMEALLSGGKGLPPINDLENACETTQRFIEDHNFFIDAVSSEISQRGFLNIS